MAGLWTAPGPLLKKNLTRGWASLGLLCGGKKKPLM